MGARLRFGVNRLRERLWVGPLAIGMLSILLVFLAHVADYTELGKIVPDITPESINTLLTIISASMLVIATFSVASMVSAYASASSTATPRTFVLILADDMSQNALSTFIGAFIFSVIALIAIENSYYDRAGRFALFALTVLLFFIVILTFVRWVDSIARLGRLGSTIDKVEAATAMALKQRQCAPTLGGLPVGPHREGGRSIFGETIGYVQRIDMGALQAVAAQAGVRIRVDALPGTFSAPRQSLAYVMGEPEAVRAIDPTRIAQAFTIDVRRIFDEDPRFGLIVLSEIASRALSPAVNDPGTAIDVIGRLVRLFVGWAGPCDEEGAGAVAYDRVEVPELSLSDMFEDAFNAIARDGAGTVEVAVRLLKGFESLLMVGDASERQVALQQARLALARAEKALDFPADLVAVRAAGRFTSDS